MAARVAVLVCIAGTVARAEPETIALLPLDAEARLEAYGQPVAGEIARALTEGKLDVVVVDAKMAMPAHAKLIVAGSITSKGSAVVLQVLVRNPLDGTTTDRLDEPAANLPAIGKAAAKLSERLLPVVRARLEVLRTQSRPKDPLRNPQVTANQPEPIILVGIGVADGASLYVEPLRLALIDAVGKSMRANRRQPSPVDASTLGNKLAAGTVAAARAERGVVFEILDYTIEPALVPLAKARVRVRIANPGEVVFDRILVTDTIVGDRQMPSDALAARVAREVFTILRPHMKKLEPAWR